MDGIKKPLAYRLLHLFNVWGAVVETAIYGKLAGRWPGFSKGVHSEENRT